MKYCVYCHTNKQNGKKYIGITSQKPESRWNNGKGYINRVYRTAHEAGRIEGVDFSSICKCVKGKKKTAGSYHWVTAEEWVPTNG